MTSSDKPKRHRRSPGDHQLEGLVHDFLAIHLGAEPIDRLELPADRRDAPRADYLLFERQAIVEVKEVVDDRMAKIRGVIEFERRLWDWPVMPPGSWLQDVLARHPRGREINNRLRDLNQKVTEKHVKDANRQLRESRVTFRIPDSIGILLIVNEHVDVLDPKVLGGEITVLMRKRTPGGALRYGDLDMAMLITSAHRLVDADGKGYPCVMYVNRHDHSRAADLERIARRVMTAWAEALGLPLSDLGTITDEEQTRRLRFNGVRPPPEV